MQSHAHTGVPVTRRLALCEHEYVIGRAFYVIDCVAGRMLWDPALPGTTPGERTAHVDEMGRTIGVLPALDAGRHATDGGTRMAIDAMPLARLAWSAMRRVRAPTART
jgi:aminoglycoside phosphotransferase (APT) family kinase protein